MKYRFFLEGQIIICPLEFGQSEGDYYFMMREKISVNTQESKTVVQDKW